MFRKYKSGFLNNNNIKYNYLINKKLPMIYKIDDENSSKLIKSKNIYDVSVSNKKQKEMRNRNNKINHIEYENDYDDDYDDYDNYYE